MVNISYYYYKTSNVPTDTTMERMVSSLPIIETSKIKYQGLNIKENKTFLSENTSYTYYYNNFIEENSSIMRLRVFNSPYEIIINKYINDMISDSKYDFTFQEGNSTPWGAEEFYHMNGEHNRWRDIFIIVYDEKVILIESQLEIPRNNKNYEIIKGLSEL